VVMSSPQRKQKFLPHLHIIRLQWLCGFQASLLHAGHRCHVLPRILSYLHGPLTASTLLHMLHMLALSKEAVERYKTRKGLVE
jgi:hypothetical protein